MLHIRAALSHLSPGIRSTAVEAWTWALEVAGPEVVGGKGGWVRGLRGLVGGIGWGDVSSTKEQEKQGGWKVGVSGGGVAREEGERVELLRLLGVFLKVGLVEGEEEEEVAAHPVWMLGRGYGLPRRGDAFGYLGLFGERRDEEGEGYRDCEERWGVFCSDGVERRRGKGVGGGKKRRRGDGEVSGRFEQNR